MRMEGRHGRCRTKRHLKVIKAFYLLGENAKGEIRNMFIKQITTAFCSAALSLFLVTAAAAQSNPAQTNSGQNPLRATPNSTNNSTQPQELSAHDRQVLDYLAKQSPGEVEISQMVESKTTNPQVKEFAQRMVHDHAILDSQVKAAFTKLGMQMPQPMTSGEDQLRSKLENESGKQLDDTYIQAQITGHEKVLRMVTPVADQGEHLQDSHPTIVELTEEIRPVLYQHLQLAKMVAKEIGAAPAQSASAK
jgi:putative membrane protein